MGGQSIGMMIMLEIIMMTLVDSHGVCQDADDDQAGSAKMMIYYEK